MCEARTENEKRLSVPLPPDIDKVVERRAKKFRRSKAMEVVFMLSEYIQQSNAETNPPQHN
jgi:hypothetical protein